MLKFKAQNNTYFREHRMQYKSITNTNKTVQGQCATTCKHIWKYIWRFKRFVNNFVSDIHTQNIVLDATVLTIYTEINRTPTPNTPLAKSPRFPKIDKICYILNTHLIALVHVTQTPAIFPKNILQYFSIKLWNNAVQWVRRRLHNNLLCHTTFSSNNPQNVYVSSIC